MQKKYVDHTDYDHLVNTLIVDFNPLLNRLNRIKELLKISSGPIHKNDYRVKNEIWINPKSKNRWSIYYDYAFIGKKLNLSFYPFTEFTTVSGEKVYLSLSKEEENDVISSRLTETGRKFDKHIPDTFEGFLSKNHWVISVFRGHFFNQFRTRLHNTAFTPMDIIFEFSVNRKFRLIQCFVQNEQWLMYLHKGGVAMIKIRQNYVVFDTYLTVSELHKEQVDAVANHFNGLNDKDYMFTMVGLMEFEAWIELIDIEKITKIIAEHVQNNPVATKQFLSQLDKKG